MKTIILFSFIIIVVFSCKNKTDNSRKTDHNFVVKQNDSLIIVYDTISKKLNKGEQLLAKARRKLRRQKDQKFEIKTSDRWKIAKLLIKYQKSRKLTQEELNGFLLINPNDLKNSAELSEMYNEALFEVVKNNNQMFAKQLVKQPSLSQKLSLELRNPVNESILKDEILTNILNEYQTLIDNRINQIENERLIMQYYIEKKNVFKELEGTEININQPEKIQELDKAKIIDFENQYKLESRIPDEGLGFAHGGLGEINQLNNNNLIRLEDVQVDLNKIKIQDQLEESINKAKLKELQKTNEMREH